MALDMNDKEAVAERLEYLRSRIHAKNISYREIYEIQELEDHIDPDDHELREWAGIESDEANDSNPANE